MRFGAANTIGTPVSLGNVRVGGTFGTSALSIQNTAAADTFSEGLNASGGTPTGAASTSGSVSNLAAGATDSTSLLVGLGGNANTGTAGARTGAVPINLASSGIGSYGATTLTGQTVTVNGGVYDLANANYTGVTLAFGIVHKGATVANQSVAFGNQTVTSASFQDRLDVSASTGNAKVTAAGFTNLIATAGGATTDNLIFSVNTATAGSLASTASLTLTSNANGVAGLSNGTATVVGSPTSITTTGGVYSGNMIWSGGSGIWNTGGNWTDSVAGGAQNAPGMDANFTGATNADTAMFGSTAGSVAVDLTGVTPKLNAVTFDGTGNYTLAGAGGTLTLEGTSPSITANGGTQVISVPVTLGSNVAVSVTAGTLNVNGAVSGGFDIAKSGGGTLNFGVAPGSLAGVGNLTASAGTTNVNSALGTGSSAVSVTGGTTTLKFGSVSQTLSSLTIGAGSTVTFTSGLASFTGGGKVASLGGSAVVPEPGTLGLLLVGTLGMLNRRRRQG